ncbi:MAG TPA: oligosaccharide flippase family protein [Nannocystaceae bacterium]|nr:oligosaccharide flippase family protein [Nannocystaceae bacterium]
MPARAAAWAIVGYLAAMVLRLGGNVILTRMLVEEAFGLMSIVNVVLVGLALFSDIGIGPSIIQNHRDDARFLNTAWTLQVGRGVVLCLVAAVLGVPLAEAYDQPILAQLMPAAGISAALAGFNSSKLFTLNRQLSVGRLTLIEIAAQAAGLVVMLGWAFVSPTVWALVIGGVVVYTTKMLLSHALPGIKNRFAWDHEAARAVIRFGRWIFVSTLLTFLVSHADRLIFAKLIPIGLLGVYSIALLIASFPSQALLNLAQTITFPLYSRTWREGGDLVRVFQGARAKLLLLGGWALAGLVAGGPTAIELLYDERYVDAGWIVQILAAGGWFGVLEATTGAALLAREQPHWVAAGSGAKLVGMIAFIPVGFHVAGFPGALVGYAAAELLRYAVSVGAATRAGLRSWPQDIAMSSVVAVSALAGWLGAKAAADAPIVIEALVVFVVVSLVWAPVLARRLKRA